MNTEGAFRHLGPVQKASVLACAAAHRAKQTEPEDTNLTTAVAADLSEQDKPPPAASPPPSPSPAAPAGQSPDHQSATLAEPLPPPPAPLPSLPRASVVSFTEVIDEVCQEQKEVKVHATGLFENCPDPCLSDEYFLSLQKFILSESHLQNNISDVKMAAVSSRQTSPMVYTHTVSVEITVNTEKLWEPPRAYIYKHLGKSEWLRGNKTRISLAKIQ